jgi:hypothetical protein
MYVGYDRLSFKGKDDENLRITFDSNLRSREDDLRLECGDYGKKYFEDDVYIMEIKTLGVIPLWFVHAINKCNIQPGHYSKYGVAYEELVLGGRKEALTVYELQKELVNELVGELAY